MSQQELVGTTLVVCKDGKVYINSLVVEGTYKETVKLVKEIYNQGYDLGKKVARKNP
jgi:hypothetical protein